MIGKEIGASIRRIDILVQLLKMEQERQQMAYSKSNDYTLMPVRQTMLMEIAEAYMRELRRRSI